MSRFTRMTCLSLVLCALTSIIAAQTATTVQTPQLISMTEKANTSGLVITFNFDSPIRAYIDSTVKWQLTKQGVTGPVQTVPATLDGAQPNSIGISIPWQDCAGAETVTAYASLIDQKGLAISTTPKIVRDLTVYGLVTDAQKSIADLQVQLTRARAGTEAASAALASVINKVVPSRVDFLGVDLIADDRIVLRYRTDLPGRIAVIRDGDTNTKQTSDMGRVTDVGSEHSVQFSGLNPATTHSFDAVVLDFEGKSTAIHASIVTKTTLARMPDFRPQVGFSTPSADRIDVNVKLDPSGEFSQFTSDLRAVTEISYKQIISKDPLQYGTTKVEFPLQLDQFGLPASALSPSRIYALTGLQAGTKYAVLAKTVDQYGHQGTSNSEVETPAKATPLGFDGPAEIQLTPTGGITAKWKANVTPKEAHLQVLFGTKTTVDEAATLDDKNPKQIQITAPVGQMQQVLNQSLSGPTPIIKLTMSDGVSSVDRQFTFSIVLPNVSSKAMSQSISASDTVSAVQKLATASQSPSKNKISWQDILSAGLGIVIKAAAL